eukprot:1710095-Alexandrium_andersonii.AAC.1
MASQCPASGLGTIRWWTMLQARLPAVPPSRRVVPSAFVARAGRSATAWPGSSRPRRLRSGSSLRWSAGPGREVVEGRAVLLVGRVLQFP